MIGSSLFDQISSCRIVFDNYRFNHDRRDYGAGNHYNRDRDHGPGSSYHHDSNYRNDRQDYRDRNQDFHHRSEYGQFGHRDYGSSGYNRQSHERYVILFLLHVLVIWVEMEILHCWNGSFTRVNKSVLYEWNWKFYMSGNGSFTQVEMEVLHEWKLTFYVGGNGRFTWVEMEVLHRCK